jgi:hypothetical protein
VELCALSELHPRCGLGTPIGENLGTALIQITAELHRTGFEPHRGHGSAHAVADTSVGCRDEITFMPRPSPRLKSGDNASR